MRVGILVHRFPPFVGGSEQYAGKLAQSLHERGHDVGVYTTKHPARPPLPYPVRELRRLSVPGSGYIVWPELLQPRLVRELARCDVLHAVNFHMFGTLAGLAIGRGSRRPCVLTSFYHPPAANPRPAFNALFDRSLGRLIANSYDAILLHSSAERRALTAHVTARPGARLRQVMSPPTTAGVRPTGSFRARIGAAGRFLVLYVGRIDAHKGAQTLLQAVADLQRDAGLTDLTVAVVGTREEWFRFPEAMETLRATLARTVRFVGPLFGGELAAAYAESDVAVVPSKYESYGFTIVEALSYGTPVIATRTGIAPDLVRPGETGFLFDYEDVAGLKQALLAARQAAAEMRVAAARSVAHIDWDQTIEATLAVYEEVLAGRGHRFAMASAARTGSSASQGLALPRCRPQALPPAVESD